MFAVIRDGKIERREGVPTLEEMQEVVGGYVDRVVLDDAEGRTIDAWVNDEGLMLKLPPTVALDGPGSVVLVGPVLVAAADLETGDTVAMTEEELDALTLGPDYLISFGFGAMVPIIRAKVAAGVA